MLKANDELRLCADAHETEVNTNDSYSIKPLLARDPNIEYVVDIGANVGAFSTYLQSLLPNAKIIACEPEEMMMVYVRLNTSDKLIYVQKAIIGDPNLKEVNFSICKWQGNHHVEGRFRMDTYAPVGSQILSSRVVPATTLMQVVEENGFPRIDLLKIDTEGSEPEILESIKPWMENIRHIVGEWHSQDDLARIKAVLAETHDTTFVDGAFKELNGAIANGEFTAELK